MKPKFYFLVGPPAVGKTEWLKRNNLEGVTKINRDDLVTQVARQSNIGTYDDMHVPPPDSITPPGMPTKEQMLSAEGPELIHDYMDKLKVVARSYNSDSANRKIIKRYGKFMPYEEGFLKWLVIDRSIPVDKITPFTYDKVKKAQESVSKMFDKVRIDAAQSRNDVVLDMVNMTLPDRNLHRKFFVAAIEGISVKDADPDDINKYYDQIAVLFEPSSGYTEEFKKLIKKVADDRNEQAKIRGESKTIPQKVYDDWFSLYTPPSLEEGFVEIIQAGVPSLDLSEHMIRKFIRAFV